MVRPPRVLFVPSAPPDRNAHHFLCSLDRLKRLLGNSCSGLRGPMRLASGDRVSRMANRLVALSAARAKRWISPCAIFDLPGGLLRGRMSASPAQLKRNGNALTLLCFVANRHVSAKRQKERHKISMLDVRLSV